MIVFHLLIFRERYVTFPETRPNKKRVTVINKMSPQAIQLTGGKKYAAKKKSAAKKKPAVRKSAARKKPAARKSAAKKSVRMSPKQKRAAKRIISVLEKKLKQSS